MTRSMFDPTGGDMASEGDTFMPGVAHNSSNLPPEVVDGKDTEEADASVPLKGGDGNDTLSQADTDALAQAADAAIRKANNPDAAPQKARPPQNPPASAPSDDDDVRWIEDI
jgi:hypothetical protein